MEKEERRFKRDVWLVIIAALVGAISGLSSPWLQHYFQRDEMLLEQRIRGLQSYSQSFNSGMRILNDEIQQTVIDKGKVIALRGQYDNRFDSIINDRATALAKLTSELTLADAEMATQTAVLKALFPIKIEAMTFLSHLDTPDLGKVTETKRADYAQKLQSEMDEFQKEARTVRGVYDRNLRAITIDLGIVQSP